MGDGIIKEKTTDVQPGKHIMRKEEMCVCLQTETLRATVLCIWLSEVIWSSNWKIKQSQSKGRFMGYFIQFSNGNPLQYSCLENPMDGGAW